MCTVAEAWVSTKSSFVLRSKNSLQTCIYIVTQNKQQIGITFIEFELLWLYKNVWLLLFFLQGKGTMRTYQFGFTLKQAWIHKYAFIFLLIPIIAILVFDFYCSAHRYTHWEDCEHYSWFNDTAVKYFIPSSTLF